MMRLQSCIIWERKARLQNKMPLLEQEQRK